MGPVKNPQDRYLHHYVRLESAPSIEALWLLNLARAELLVSYEAHHMLYCRYTPLHDIDCLRG
jgi:hypothetical protein